MDVLWIWNEEWHKKVNKKDKFLPNIDDEDMTALHLSRDLYKIRDFFVSLVCSM